MKKPVMVVTPLDDSIKKLAAKADHKRLAIWASDCAERVLPYFEEQRPADDRPRRAIEAARTWVRTGVFKMAEVRGFSLAAHAAAREVEEYSPARSAARATGQAIATAHVGGHALAAAVYAATALRDSLESFAAEDAAVQERRWQYQHLLDLVGAAAARGEE